ncbi:hypothetical protein ELQ35_21490 [Peribacillus cavernae]|uniref:Rhamnogalacturonase A/B/Epimerase-like pectate lyase domain-containing protein n=1 Tax=Peribacillus cavernae TaxID=1674310 RepID=A0A3S1B0P8_9BACI|nr:glycosyl hydrolase family 28-related protein [Peribacillus cavernae]MDQ0221447.1 hypothetical protein [Peribacillus cavernae]RUQ24553.1 hypothetical protein ELQ35_21490 [Peribacillus cavernae]
MNRRNLIRSILLFIFAFIFGYTVKKEGENIVFQRIDSNMVKSKDGKSIADEIEGIKQDLSQRAINVRQPPYNAKADGKTDDTLAIQKAIDSLNPGDKLYFPRGVYNVPGGLTLNKRGVEFIGQSRGYYDTAVLQSTNPNSVILTVKEAGFSCENIRFLGDGDLYGVNATVTGLKLIGAFSSNPNFDVDALISKCSFFKLKICIEQKGKNVVIENNNLSNSTIGVNIHPEGVPTDFRGLEIRDNRFHSLGGKSNPESVCINVNPHFRELMITTNYFDDCFVLIKGGAVGMSVIGNMITRAYGGFEFDMTNSDVLRQYDKRIQLISNNILTGISAVGVNKNGISIIDKDTGLGRWIVSNNVISFFSFHGIYAKGIKNSSISGNHIDTVASDTSKLYDFIHIEETSERVAIKNNTMSGASKNIRWGINIESAKTASHSISNNDFFAFESNTINNRTIRGESHNTADSQPQRS